MCSCDDGSRAGTLYGLFPKDIEQNEFYKIIRRKADNLTITAREKVYLISITPKDDETKQKLRNFLKTVTIDITYTDLYEKEYSYNRKLDFFGKDVGKQGIFLSQDHAYGVSHSNSVVSLCENCYAIYMV
jgi:hypothetical protein